MKKPTDAQEPPKILSDLTSRHEAILDAALDIILEVDVNKVCRWANRAGLDFFGADVIGKEASFYFADEQNNYEKVKPLFEGNENVTYVESWQHRKDGLKRLLAWWCRVLKNESGSVSGAILTARDLTEKRQIEKQLHFQNQLFENTLKSLTHPFYVIDVQDYSIKMANAATARFGRITEGTKCYSLTHNLDTPCFGFEHSCPLELIKKTKKPVKTEHIHFDEDGTKRNYEIHGFPIKDDKGNIVQMIEYSLDITERKRVEEALIESKSKWRALTENSPDFIMLLDCDARVLLVNHPLPGLTASEMIGKPYYNFIMSTSRKSIKNLFKQVIMTGRSDKFENTYVVNDDEIFFFESYVVPIRKGDTICGLTISCRDITSQKTIQSALQKSHQDLETRVRERTNELAETNIALRNEISKHKKAERARKRVEFELAAQRTISMRSDRLRSLGQMAAGIAHELNQPLVGVRGLTEHLLIGIDRGWHFSEEKIREKLSLIIEQADRMSHIIEHVRLFARNAGKPEKHMIKVNDVVRSAINMLGAQINSRGIELNLDLCTEDARIHANPFSLEEVILNLLLNARDAIEAKFSDAMESSSGKIRIRTFNEFSGDVKSIYIQVEDNGIGIESHILSKVFDPFFTTKEPDKGTGLGLAISKAIIEQFNGEIDIQSVDKIGTTVTLTFFERKLRTI